MGATPGMVNMLTPDGQLGTVPAANVPEAMADGHKIAVHVFAPDGTAGYVPHDALPQALRDGMTASPATPQANNDAQRGLINSAVNASGLSTLGSLVAHPIDSVRNIPNAVAAMMQNTASNVSQGVQDYKNSGLSETTRRDFGRAIPIIGPALAQAQAQHDIGNNSGMAGTLAGTVAGLAGPKLLEGAPEGLQTLGEGMQNRGVGIINTTVGALKKDMQRGTNPGQGYFDAGLGPSSSLASIANKAASAKADVGAQLGNAYDSATASGVRIPADAIARELQGPLNTAYGLEQGPGGMGNTAALDNYSAGFRPSLQNAANNGGMTPTDLFNLKQAIAKNTNWADPSQFNLKAVRQQQTGAVGGLLTDAVPETEDLNSLYANLNKLAARSKERSLTGSSPLTGLAVKAGSSGIGAALGAAHGTPGMIAGALSGLVADSVPVRTTGASALFYGGKGAVATGVKLRTLFGPP